MALDREIDEIRASIRAGRFMNEAAVSQGIVLRLLGALGWPTYDTQVVSPQYALESRRVDYALCDPPGKPIALVEVKQIGQSDGAERQLFEYAFHGGVPIVILTDGQEWNFFLPGEQGNYGERRVYKLDIVERDIEECSHRLTRYLQYEAIRSGAAIESAREDYRNVSRERLMKSTLPQAWKQLVEEEDELLLELLADRVESLCGYKPDPDTAASFLKSQASRGIDPPRPNVPLSHPRTSSSPPVTASSTYAPIRTGFVLNGKHHPARNARDVLVKVFEALTERDPNFPDRFASLPKHGRKRRYLSKSPDELYPGRQDLARDHSMQMRSGWWLSTNHSRATIARIIEMACHVVHLQYGSDLRIELDD